MWVYSIRRLLYTIPILLGVMLLTFMIFFGITPPETYAAQVLGEKSTKDQRYLWLYEEEYARLNQQGQEKIKAIEKEALERQAQLEKEYKEKQAQPEQPDQATEAVQKEADESEAENPSVKSLGAADIVIKSYPELFFKYLWESLRFDWGKNRDNRPVIEVIRQGMIPSLKLTLPAFILSEILGVFFALFAALYRNTKIDRTLVLSSIVMMSFSPVAIILFAQYFLSARWGYFPISGYTQGIGAYAYLALPILIYVYVRLGELIRFNRIVILDEIGQDYVRTARAKGLGQNSMLFKHVLRNVMIPLITRWVIAIPFLYLGSLLLESFFGIPGLGGITIIAVENSDLNMIRALVFIGTLIFVFSQLLSDILYAFADPRVKLG